MPKSINSNSSQANNQSGSVEAVHPTASKSDPALDRFSFDKHGFVFDRLNPVDDMLFYYGGCQAREDIRYCPPSQFELRESVLFRRLHVLVRDLIPNSYDDTCITVVVVQAIRSSALSTVEPSRGTQFRFGGTLKHNRTRLKDITSLKLFFDDVECLVRDLYGDVDDSMMTEVLCTVREIIDGFVRFVRPVLRQEDSDASSADLFLGGSGLGDDCKPEFDRLKSRVRDVKNDPNKHGKYTVEFARLFKERMDEYDRKAMVRLAAGVHTPSGTASKRVTRLHHSKKERLH